MILRILTLVFCAIGVYFLGTLALQGSRSRCSVSCLLPRVDPRRGAPCVRSPAVAALEDGSAASRVDVVDVSPLVAASDIAALLHLRPGEHVTAVGDCAVQGDRDAAAWIAARPPRRGGFVDLTVSGAAGARRVLVLRH